MAESADILTPPEQAVYLPNPTAGCLMADMAPEGEAIACWEQLRRLPGRTVPVTYVNSSAAVKALVGRNGGAACTSSNAARVLRWALQNGDRILFLPDQHLGRNTAHGHGNRGRPDAGLAARPAVGRARRKRRCSRPASSFGPATATSTRCSRCPTSATSARPTRPCASSSTRSAPSTWSRRPTHTAPPSRSSGQSASIRRPAIGRWAPEITLVQRLARQCPDRTVVPLTRFGTWCANMGRIALPHLLHALEGLDAGRPPNRVRVPAETAAPPARRWSGCCRWPADPEGRAGAAAGRSHGPAGNELRTDPVRRNTVRAKE